MKTRSIVFTEPNRAELIEEEVRPIRAHQALVA